MQEFVHLHVHSEYSLLDGAARIKDLVARAAGAGMPAMALTDHGSMFGIVDFYRACRKAEIKPILGCEVYVAPRQMSDRQSGIDDKMTHLVLLAENEQGYRNLLAVVSYGYIHGFYYKPRVDKELLARHHEGLIALSGCLAGEVANLILKGEPEKALESVAEYRDIFGRDNYFLELQDHGLQEQIQVNRELIEIARRTGLAVVATNDIHYVNASDAEVQDILLCIQTGKTVDDPQRLRFDSKEFYFKTGMEMARLFTEVPTAVSNTLVIAERCNVSLDFDTYHLPEYQVPPRYDADGYLRELCFRGARERYGAINETIQKRLDFELNVISEMRYSSYFLIVWDFIRFAREREVLVGPGRGSAAGSLVAYALGITNLDPLPYGLLFERFLNPERVSMPDIDIDFCYERRSEVIDYVFEKYGRDCVAQIITFGTMAAKAAVRDVGRALGMPYGEVDRVAKLIPAELGVTIDKALATPELKTLYDDDPQVAKLIDMARALEGTPRHASIHAAGVVIAREKLTSYLPLYRTTDGVVATQFAKETVEDLGLLKMDLLGLRTLTVIGDAVKMIREKRGIKLDIDRIPLDDFPSYDLLGRGETVGVFQLESSGMRGILKEMKPESFEDVIALVALYRPGPLGSGMVEDFIKRKHGEIPVKYAHPKLEPILRDTYGVILYQEQVMRIASDLAGFSLGEADLLRRAMGKKKPEIIAGLRSQFIDGARANQVDPNVAGQIFDLMAYFAGYGFNKSHSAAYALIAYQTAYLKANYPLEYMAALLTSVRDSADKIGVYVEECRRMGIEVLPPDVNESLETFTTSGGKLRFGLAAVRNVGVAAVQAIIEARNQDGFSSFADFAQRLDSRVMNRRILEGLVRSGAFASLGPSRAQLLAVLDEAVQLSQRAQKEKASNQLTLFGGWTGHQACTMAIPQVPEFPHKEILAMEKDALGLYISGHPLEDYRDLLRAVTTANAGELGDMPQGKGVVLGGLVTSVKRITTKKGAAMCFLDIEDLTGKVEVVVFPRTYEQYRENLTNDNVILVRGSVDITHHSDTVKILADQISGVESEGAIKLTVPDGAPETVQKVISILDHYRGHCPVQIVAPGLELDIGQEYAVNLATPVVSRLKDVLGTHRVHVRWGLTGM
ncbi:MAG: DNA polymerase III subunit alpha [Desulforudis sp.]|nr:MAG: DNA polymerase III subunit alpha [Desulforudis sp.]